MAWLPCLLVAGIGYGVYALVSPFVAQQPSPQIVQNVSDKAKSTSVTEQSVKEVPAETEPLVDKETKKSE